MQEWSPYNYCFDNPLRFEDKDGTIPFETIWDAANVGMGARSFIKNIREGKIGAAVVDGLGVIVDAAATVVPYVPGGVSAGIKTIRGVDKTVDAIDAMRAADKAKDVLKTGKWAEVSENMSDAAASYQKQISGVDASKSFVLNKVKFDGVTKDGLLLDAKSGMKNFVGKDGNFESWFDGADEMVDQANRQLKEADGAPIQWHFENKNVMEATRNLFKKNDIEGIELIYTPRK